MQTASSAPRKGALTRALSAPGTANGLILLGAVLQVLFFILYLINGDVHVDEAMLVLNARSLAREGTDIFGQRMPVYFDTWLYGGQSSLATSRALSWAEPSPSVTLSAAESGAWVPAGGAFTRATASHSVMVMTMVLGRLRRMRRSRV